MIFVQQLSVIFGLGIYQLMFPAAGKHADESDRRVIKPVESNMKSRSVPSPEELLLVYEQLRSHGRLRLRLFPQAELGPDAGNGKISDLRSRSTE